MFQILPNWHPILVHFTVALLTISTVLFVISAFAGAQAWAHTVRTVAYWDLWLGAAITVLTVIAGLYAFSTVTHDTAAHAAMIDHRSWALPTAALFILLAVWSIWLHRDRSRTSPLFAVLMVIGFGLLTMTALEGGELVYRHGLGVLSLPKAETGHHHDGHEHSEGAGGHQHGD